MSELDSVVGGMTLAELARLAKTTVEEIVEAAMRSTKVGAPRSRERLPARRTPTPKTRAPAALPVYAVLKLLSQAGTAVARRKICESLGAEPDAVLVALEKLVAAGQVHVIGRGRAKRYQAGLVPHRG